MADINLSHKGKIGRREIMRLKPKSTTKNPKALLYKRFIGLEKSVNLNIVYNTVSDGLFWTFDNLTLEFTQVESSALPQGAELTVFPEI